MPRVWWLLTSLLMADAFVLPLLRQEPPNPPIPVVLDSTLVRQLMFYLPVLSMFMAFRSVDLMVKSSLLIQTMTSTQSVMEVMLTQMPNILNSLRPGSRNGTLTRMGQMAKKSCVLKMLCELTAERWSSRRHSDISKTMNTKKEMVYDEKINLVVNMNVEGSNETDYSNSCESRYSGCPLSARDILLPLSRLLNPRNPFRVQQIIPPIVDIPFIEEDEDYDYVIL